ncbi:Alpha/Beta hydrolase protein [Cokeromyces recurvatus]|uniref:Alpha/Beta hydrolase protein n=1 Tax=Cokeromyces recurvatus TaxID=90255 RepID=UPI00221FEE03|nr:Alpha/Beta hydrolase protein [Cokeromyces recurvatus]KAI7897600.1 Alpha/Beta hydrolase protein [Cokeromyces recurvatus]
MADEFAKRVPVPETITFKQEVFGGPKNLKVGTTVFKPLNTENEILPVILYLHGGGWVFGNAITHRKIATDLCLKTHAAVMLVEYSLSPEVKFPVANEQSFAALCWLREHGSSININPDQIAVVGDSAGGNMAAVVSMMAKDRGIPNAIKAQILMYPAVDADFTLYESYKLYGGGECYLSLKEAELCSKAYLPKPALELNDRYATPILATKEDLMGLPPALVLTSECDILRDGGEAYVSKLIEAGVYTVGMRILGSIHAFMTTPIPDTPQYRTCIRVVCDFIKEQTNFNQ